MTPEALLAAAEAVERAYRAERGLDPLDPLRALAQLATKYRSAQHPSPASDTDPGTKVPEGPSWRL